MKTPSSENAAACRGFEAKLFGTEKSFKSHRFTLAASGVYGLESIEITVIRLS